MVAVALWGVSFCQNGVSLALTTPFLVVKMVVVALMGGRFSVNRVSLALRRRAKGSNGKELGGFGTIYDCGYANGEFKVQSSKFKVQSFAPRSDITEGTLNLEL